ncbi:MAG: DUF1592 domain-containing protein [Alphaproteobacteria bacterium]|nr:DUF1592 domain-containing protein [Alphaproteobacteria bacterium]
MSARSSTLASLLALAACTPETAAPVDELAPAEAWGEATPAPAALRRLTAAQYAAALHDLFGDDVVVPAATGPDLPLAGLVAAGSSVASYAPRAVESLESAAFSVADQVVSDPARRARILACDPATPPDAACRTETLRRVGRRAWRRPLTPSQLGRLTAVSDQAAEALGDPWQGLAFGLAALLQSPNLLYRTEVGTPDGGLRRFDDHELASRLSFLLWNTGPDEVLLDAAEAGELRTREGRLAQAERLLDDPRARAGLRAIFEDAWGLGGLDDLRKDPTLFEHAHPELGPDAREETLRLVEHLVLDADTDIRTVLSTRQTFLNPRLAALYGLPAPDPEGWRLVDLPASSGRRGLLGQAAFLALNAHAVSSSATLRGKAIRVRLLCDEIPNPPVNVDTSIPEPSGTTRTLRDRVAEHLTNPTCAACHELTDPLGLGLEQFDGIGRWRTTDQGAVIDPSGDVDGTPFRDAAELATVLAEHPDVPRCMARTVVRYARGTLETAGDEPWLGVLEDRFAVHDHRVRPLLLELVASPLFTVAGEVP